ncbi:hypothetical protein PIB30_066213 [Stylosanthes scabra]|uniref:F-box associated domain-containing protein n=1 Tax=Stylosanthes scabra TaxID=79078 RepID=A0ABU6YKZ3_9FABA|nr:hypothetical protein [Stylosanthes scabra]
MWQLSQHDGFLNWTLLYMYEGVAPTYRSFLLLEEDEIQIMERHMGIFCLEDINITHFHITRCRAVSRKWRQILTSFEFLHKSYKLNMDSFPSSSMSSFLTGMSTTYCIIHAFKRYLDDPLIFYTVYSSATKRWSDFEACEGNLTRLGSEYVSLGGEVSWINYTGDNFESPDSVITYSIIDASWRKMCIPAKCKSGSHKLLNFKGQVSIASYPTDDNQYMITVRSITYRIDGSLRWKGQLKLEGLRRYEQPKFFIHEDLITLTEETEEIGTGQREILLSRIQESKDYLRRHL